MSIDPAALQQALSLFVIGWGGDFLVLGLIALASIVLCKAFPVKKDDK